MFNFTKIKSNEAAFFAYKAWRIPYAIGTLIILSNLIMNLLNSASLLYTTGFASFIKSVFSTIADTAVLLAGWTIGSSLILLLAFAGKKFGRRYPLLIFVLFPLPISLISFFIFYKIILMLFLSIKEASTILGPLGFILVVGSAGIVSIILILINLISWKAALSEYNKLISFKQRVV